MYLDISKYLNIVKHILNSIKLKKRDRSLAFLLFYFIDVDEILFIKFQKYLNKI